MPTFFRLAWNLAKRDIAIRFRGSLLGAVWLVINPLFTLAIYYYVFAIIFKARWTTLRSDGLQADIPGSLAIFAGLIVFMFFSECLLRAPGLIRENTNYVKKVIFPLEILPIMATMSSLFTACINILLLLLFYIFVLGVPSWHIIFLPIVLLPLVIGTLGVVYALSALGVYLPDLKNLMGPISMALMFLTPIMYPISIIPEKLRIFILFNPLTSIVEEMRAILFAHSLPSVQVLIILLAASLLILILGFWGFKKLCKGFADVL